MRLIRRVPFDLSVVDAAQDIVELTASEGRQCYIVGVHIGKCGATPERTKLTYNRHPSDSTSGSVPVTGGGTATIAKSDDGADGFVAESGNETRATGGTGGTVLQYRDVMDPSTGYDWVPPTEDEAIAFRDGERLTVGLEAALASGQQLLTGTAVVAVEV